MATQPKQRNLGRLSEIAQVAVKHGFGYVLDSRRAAPWSRKTEQPDTTTASERGRHLKEMLRSKCGCDHVPEELAERIRTMFGESPPVRG